MAEGFKSIILLSCVQRCWTQENNIIGRVDGRRIMLEPAHHPISCQRSNRLRSHGTESSADRTHHRLAYPERLAARRASARTAHEQRSEGQRRTRFKNQVEAPARALRCQVHAYSRCLASWHAHRTRSPVGSRTCRHAPPGHVALIKQHRRDTDIYLIQAGHAAPPCIYGPVISATGFWGIERCCAALSTLHAAAALRMDCTARAANQPDTYVPRGAWPHGACRPRAIMRHANRSVYRVHSCTLYKLLKEFYK
eukprot:SAG31_NODE_1449_length_8308_cov_2.319893_3_plen_253_part_00